MQDFQYFLPGWKPIPPPSIFSSLPNQMFKSRLWELSHIRREPWTLDLVRWLFFSKPHADDYLPQAYTILSWMRYEGRIGPDLDRELFHEYHLVPCWNVASSRRLVFGLNLPPWDHWWWWFPMILSYARHSETTVENVQFFLETTEDWIPHWQGWDERYLAAERPERDAWRNIRKAILGHRVEYEAELALIFLSYLKARNWLTQSRERFALRLLSDDRAMRMSPFRLHAYFPDHVLPPMTHWWWYF